jgi:hypothetical protein
MAAKKKITIKQVEPLIDELKGNVAAIARRLGVNRSTVWSRIQQSEKLISSIAQARETMLDNAESVLYSRVLEGHTAELLFFLKTQGYRRGYVERREITGAEGGPLVVVNWDATDDSD